MENKVFSRPSLVYEGAVSGFCPGCMHTRIGSLICEVLEEMGQEQKVIQVRGIGCSGLHTTYIDTDLVNGPHGRTCAVASAVKRCCPDALVYTYQGDGDLASIGLAETMSAANRGENFTVFLVNNGIYGMTGGQMSPTTLVGTKTTTSPYGRNPEAFEGYPMHMCELLNQLTAPAYIARVTCADVANIRKAKEAVKKAFTYQLEGKGFSFVEFISNCPTNWGMSPLKSLDYIHDVILKEFPLGEFRAK